MAILISTPQELHNVRNNLTGDYELVNDIDMSSWGNFKPIGTSTSSQRFKGKFNGKGFKVKNLNINESTANVGLFGYTENATIQNIGIENAIVVGNNVNYVGILVGNNTNTTISNCYSTGEVKGQYGVGGLVGWYNNVTIEDCYSHAKVTGTGRVGGLVGNGVLATALINRSYSTGLVTVTPDPNTFNGGLVGSHTDSTKVTNSYYDINTSSQSVSAGGIGKVTSEMKQQSTYIGWDFTSIWGINGDYPYLQIFGVPTAPPKKEIITVSSFVYAIGSNARKHISSTKLLNTFTESIQTTVERHTVSLRHIEGYLSQIETNAVRNARTVRSDTKTVDSYISPIYSSLYKESKTVKQLLAYMKPLQSHVEVLIPIDNKVVNAYLSVIQNPSRVSEVANCSEVQMVLNPSEVEVIT